jgi:hypothetical protein
MMGLSDVSGVFCYIDIGCMRVGERPKWQRGNFEECGVVEGF